MELLPDEPKQEEYNDEKIEKLIIQELASITKRDPLEISLADSLENYALDSVDLVRLTETLSEILNLELDPILLQEYQNLDELVKGLSSLHQKQVKSDQGKIEIKINLVSSFTSEPIEESLNYWLGKLSFKPKIEFAAYNQVSQELLNPGSFLYTIQKGANILLIRIEDWFRFDKTEVSEEKVREVVNNFLSALQTAASQSKVPIILGLCAHSGAQVRKLGISPILDQLDQDIISFCEQLNSVYLIDLRNIEGDYQLETILDPKRDQLGHIPFTQEYFAALGTILARKLYALFSYQLQGKTNEQEVLNNIALLSGNIQVILQLIHSHSKVKRPKLSNEFITPRTIWQKKIAAIWCDILRIDQVGIYDNFYELGGDSSEAIEVFTKMLDLGIPETISPQMIQDPTVAGIAQLIEDARSGKQNLQETKKFSLEDEAVIPAHICNEGYDISTYDVPMKTVFFTGGTGYVGSFLVAELLDQTNVKIFCLVRGATKSEASLSIKRNLVKNGIWKDEYESRLEYILGDINEPLFGLKKGDFDDLSRKIDTIIHCAAKVNWVYPYEQLKQSNVFSTQTVMELAVNDRPRPIQVHFISTLGVIMSSGYPKGVPIYEDNELSHSEGLLNGYEQTKYVGDKMIWKGIKERGIPASIYRPALITGSSSGVYTKLNEFFPSFLKGIVQLGSCPLTDTFVEIIPIDFFAKALVHIFSNPKNLGKAYFSLHPHSKSLREFVDWLINFGYPMRVLPWDIWKKEFLNQGFLRLRHNSLLPFIGFIRALTEEQCYYPITDKSNFINAIKDLDYPILDPLELLENYVNYFIKIGYFPLPKKS